MLEMKRLCDNKCKASGIYITTKEVLAMLKVFRLVLGLYFCFFVAAFAQETSNELQNNIAQCAQGSALSCRKVATIESNLNQSDKLDYLNQACGLGDEFSCLMPNLAFDINNDRERATQVTREYCELNNSLACYMLAGFHGVWKTATTQEVIELFNKSCELENSVACTILAALYLTGGEEHIRADVNIPLALELLERACDLQSSSSFEDEIFFADGESACAAFARILRKGEFVDANLQTAVNFLASSCDIGDRTSCRELGKLYEFGSAGLQKDLAKSSALFDDACEMGDSDGCYWLGIHYEINSEETNKFYYASRAYLKGCELNDSGYLCLEAGKVIAESNPFDAKVAYEVGCLKQYQAAENCYRVAELYEHGVGVRKNLSSAIEYYGRACDLRMQLACENYARLY